MSWKTVNVTVIVPQQSPTSLEAQATPDEPANAFASKFRVNILHAAEKLANSIPKRKRRASKPVALEPAPKKSKKTSNKKQPAAELSVLKEEPDETTSSPARRSARLQTPKTESSPDPEIGTSRLESSRGLQHAAIKKLAADAEGKDKSTANEPEDKTSISTKLLDPFVEVKASSGSYSSDKFAFENFPDDTSIKFDGSDSFDDFDDSVFDGPLAANFETDSSSQIAYSPATTAPLTSPADPNPGTNKLAEIPISEVGAAHPKGAPFAPFMHPCLLDSMDAEAVALNRKDASTPSLKHTCFRAAELLRLAKSFRTKPIAEDIDLVTEFFATVKEVKYADSQGQGQGLILADIFFPNKPPFITASSRIPYNARDLIPQGQAKEGSKRPVKATIKVLGTRSRSNAWARKPRSSPVKSSQTTPFQSSPIVNDQEFEVTDVQTTSWEEIGQAKQMIEKDLRVRNKSPTKTKDYTTVVHRHWPKEEEKQKYSPTKTSNTVKAYGSEDQLLDMNEFPDDDFDLPDIEAIFRRASQ
ncbi:hypothetical protein OHC33_002362 [Knufia fluminis]|uniref:Uncharacterized protein n=1 Tax=Knufia fluminis TaxID=191047 RepID=A0AAN8ER09_9EURO|nr:hypothetical protein OHC33_002362 [Knufia fluminis]